MYAKVKYKMKMFVEVDASLKALNYQLKCFVLSKMEQAKQILNLEMINASKHLASQIMINKDSKNIV